jgi:hypothetical protein
MLRLRRAGAERFFPADEGKTPFWLYALITVICGGLAFARLGRTGPNTIWAEDGQIFYTGAVEHPLHSFLEPYHGYLVTGSRVLAAVVALFPLSWAAAANAAVDALAMGLLAALVYRACAAHIRTRWLRLVPAVATAICPLGGETWGVIANLMWPMYFVVVLVMLWNPRRPAPIAIGAVAALVLTLTSPFGILLVPIAVVRIAALGRDRGSVIPAVTLAGVVAQTAAMLLGGARQMYTTVLLGKLASNYWFNVAERGFFGARYQIPDYETVGLVAAAAVLAAIVLVGVAGKGRQCAHASLMLVYSVGYYAALMVLSGTFAGHSTGDRYYVGPFLLLAYAMVVAFDAAITRDGPRGGTAVREAGTGPRPSPPRPRLARLVPRAAAVVLCAALTGSLAFSVVTDWPLTDKARQAPTWSASLAGARAWCAGKPGNETVRIPITASHPAVPWYVILSCSRVR